MSKREIDEISTSREFREKLSEITEEIKDINEKFYLTNGRKKTYHILTYGCQMNEHDSEKIAGILSDLGFMETENEDQADFLIFNTCLIRENAELRVYGKLGEIKGRKKVKPGLMTAVCGCMMQKQEIRERLLKQYPFVDIIFGTNTIHELPELIYSLWTRDNRSVGIIDNTELIFEDMPKVRKFKHKALINITYGCNNYCSYCVVPYTRGREKSRNPEDIINEATRLAADGCKEITLLGQNVNSYGCTLKQEYTFARLLRELNEVDGLERIRFMTSHPKDLTDELIETVRDCKNVCNHVHLPVQSGSNLVLKAMNRKYTREHYIELVGKLRAQVPDIAITTDIIVGFPGETEADFEDTVRLVQECEFDSAFTFLYSKREGTKAAAMEDQIPEDIKHRRFDKLLDVLYPIVYEKNKLCLGNTYSVLAESVSKHDDEFLTGRTEHFRLVHFKGPHELIGSIVKVKIDDVKTFFMEGTVTE